ncbi:MAG: PorV/PorQ family protein [candidate division Zixibacteria bacterium]|nr:PorV/PorQ family protein [candidate division Zixibacteria bacterium]
MKKLVSIAVLLMLMTAPSGMAAEDDAGYAGAFLYIPIGARPAAMGGAYLAVSDDGAGAMYNPAGLSNIKRTLFGTSYRVMTLDRILGYATVIVPTKGQSALGVHWLYAGDKGLKARDDRGVIIPGFDISKNDHEISIVFAKRFEKIFSAGLKMNYLQSSFVGMSAFGVGFDLGGMFYLSELFDRNTRDLMAIQDIRAGITVKYLGAEYRWNNENYVGPKVPNQTGGTVQKDKVPVEFGLGGSARFFDRKLLLATDILKNTKQSPFFHAGAEYTLHPKLALRGGFSAGRLTAGTGFIFEVGDRTIAVDYAFSTDKVDEGSEHIFSFDFLF